MSVPRVWCQPSNMLCKESELLKAKGCAQYLQNLQPGISQCYTHSPLTRQLRRIFPRPGLWWQLKHSARVALRLSTLFILSSQVIINLRSISYMTRDWQNSCNKLITIELGWSYLEPVKIHFLHTNRLCKLSCITITLYKVVRTFVAVAMTGIWEASISWCLCIF